MSAGYDAMLEMKMYIQPTVGLRPTVLEMFEFTIYVEQNGWDILTKPHFFNSYTNVKMYVQNCLYKNNTTNSLNLPLLFIFSP